MLTRPFRVALILVLMSAALLPHPRPAFSQAATPSVSIAGLQLEIRRLRKRSEELRGELKRQQRAVGIVQHELDAQREVAAAQEAETGRLRERAEALRRWLMLLGVVSVTGVVIGLLRRAGNEDAPAPLAVARERTGRIHEGLAALEARIQVIERRSPEG